MTHTDKRIRLCTAWLILNLAVIWGNSLLPGDLSGAFSDWVKELIQLVIPGAFSGPEGSGGTLLRKLGHFTEFCALGMCLCWLHGMLGKRQSRSLLWGFLSACADETIQRFVPGRNPSLMDVAIDTAGVLAGISLLLIGHHILKKRNNQHILEEQ